MGQDLQAEFVALGPDGVSSDARFEPSFDHRHDGFDLDTIAIGRFVETRLHQPSVVATGGLRGEPTVFGWDDRTYVSVPRTTGDEIRWVVTTPVDMRKSFDSLAEVVRSFLGHDPLSGNLFVFRNKGGQLAKVLWWDRDGLAIYYKRLERGEFRWPRSHATAVELSPEQLLRLLSGGDAKASRAG